VNQFPLDQDHAKPARDRKELPMNSRIVRPVVAGIILALSVYVATAQTQSLAGDWSGQSICGGGNPSCHDEYVVYHLTVDALDATKVKIAADKIVDGKLEWMGDILLKYDATKQTLTGDLANARVKGVWEFVVKGDTIEGTLSIFNPDKTIGRRIHVQKNGTSQRNSSPVTNHATGTFDVKLTPQDDKSDDKSIGRMTIDKQWHGDLEGTSKGQMLTGGDATKGSAGYVAIEKFTGALKGHKGTFILQHTATMTQGKGDLTITVVPDSGTEGLKGIAGQLTIRIENGKHFYDFEYSLP
jgi:hypothetical protein